MREETWNLSYKYIDRITLEFRKPFSMRISSNTNAIISYDFIMNFEYKPKMLYISMFIESQQSVFVQMNSFTLSALKSTFSLLTMN